MEYTIEEINNALNKLQNRTNLKSFCNEMVVKEARLTRVFEDILRERIETYYTFLTECDKPDFENDILDLEDGWMTKLNAIEHYLNEHETTIEELKEERNEEGN